jgi:hypothetical protein
MRELEKSVYRNLSAAVKSGLVTSVSIGAVEFDMFLRTGELPESLVPSVESVRAMLLAHSVAGVSVSKTASGKIVVESVSLSNGVSLSFGVSPYGAVVYRMSKPSVSVERRE